MDDLMDLLGFAVGGLLVLIIVTNWGPCTLSYTVSNSANPGTCAVMPSGSAPCPKWTLLDAAACLVNPFRGGL